MNNNLVVEKIDVPDVDSFLSKIVAFFKKQIVLTIAIIAMTITCFFIPIDRQYLAYFNWPTLVTLYCTLAVVEAFANSLKS